MNTDIITIHCTNTGTYKEFPAGTDLINILNEFDLNLRFQIVNANVNNKTEPLTYQGYHTKTGTFLDMTDNWGMRTCVRSICFLLAKSVDEF